MAEKSLISWTDNTFNPWIGCSKVSPACFDCYAERDWAKGGRFNRVEWGPGAERSRTGTDTWKKPLQWNREALRHGGTCTVFCASLADWLDHEVPLDWLADLLSLTAQTPNLRWLLLTKRPENYATRIPAALELLGQPNLWPLPNVAIGCTIENQAMAEKRLPLLAGIPAAMRFVSCEPLLERVDLGAYPIDWVISGGKSGPHHGQTFDVNWARDLKAQCDRYGRAFHLKQLGQYWVDGERSYTGSDTHGKIQQFPADLQIQGYPDWMRDRLALRAVAA
jgi:protein gp37